MDGLEVTDTNPGHRQYRGKDRAVNEGASCSQYRGKRRFVNDGVCWRINEDIVVNKNEMKSKGKMQAQNQKHVVYLMVRVSIIYMTYLNTDAFSISIREE